jgi:HJR/Mrr/RecB family endonuclease
MDYQFCAEKRWIPPRHRHRYKNTPASFASLIFFVAVAISPLVLGWFARYPETIPLALFAAITAMIGFVPFFITITYVKTQEAERRSLAIADWYRLTPSEFELYVATLFQTRGYRVQLVGGPGDGGIDIWLEKNGEQAIAQCKQYTNKKVDVTAIQKFADVLTQSRAARGYFVTTSFFTGPARQRASRLPITLTDRDALIHWLKEAKAGPYSQPIHYPLFFSAGQWLALILLGTTIVGMLGFLLGVLAFG